MNFLLIRFFFLRLLILSLLNWTLLYFSIYLLRFFFRILFWYLLLGFFLLLFISNLLILSLFSFNLCFLFVIDGILSDHFIDLLNLLVYLIQTFHLIQQFRSHLFTITHLHLLKINLLLKHLLILNLSFLRLIIKDQLLDNLDHILLDFFVHLIIGKIYLFLFFPFRELFSHIHRFGEIFRFTDTGSRVLL